MASNPKQQQRNLIDLDADDLYTVSFRDWKQAQCTIQSSMDEVSNRPGVDSLAVIGGRSSRRDKEQESNATKKREKQRRALQGERTVPLGNPRRSSRRSQEQPTRGRELPTAVSIRPSTGINPKERRQRWCLGVLLAVAVLSTLAAIALPILVFQRIGTIIREAENDASTASGNSNIVPDNENSVFNTTVDEPASADPKDPEGDLVHPNQEVPVHVAPNPVPAPTLSPTKATASPSRSPVTWAPVSSTPPPNNDAELLLQIRSVVTVGDLHFQDEDSPYFKAFFFVARLDVLPQDNLVQRFAMSLLNAAVDGAFASPTQHECSWTGVTCDDDDVTGIAWPNYSLRGHLPQDIGLLGSLTSLDLAENQIWGTIPESLYDGMSSLEDLFLHQNNLSGPLSESIGKLTNLKRLYLASNYLSGPLPQYLGSPSVGANNVRPLGTKYLQCKQSISSIAPEYLSLYDNHFTGVIPSDWNLRRLRYIDLGKNKLQGNFPVDWVQGSNIMNRLRLLYLDQNNLRGELPPNLGTIGKGRLMLLSLHTNSFSGILPGFHNNTHFLNVLEVQNNQFSSMDQLGICSQIVFNGGEMVMMRADCVACRCNYFCAEPWCYSG